MSSASSLAARLGKPVPRRRPIYALAVRDESWSAAVFYVVDAIGIHFRLTQGRSDVYTAVGEPVHYDKTQKTACVTPDMFLTFGLTGPPRDVYRVWDEGRSPDLCLDVISPLRRQERPWSELAELYAQLGVKECWRFDPAGEHLRPRLQGYRLERDGYVALASLTVGDELVIRSDLTDLDFRCSNRGLRVREPLTGRVFPTRDEAEAELKAADFFRQDVEDRLEAAKRYRRRAEAELAAEMNELKIAEAQRDAATQERRRAEAELAAATQERRRAEAELDTEAEALRTAEARVEELEKQLARSRRSRKYTQPVAQSGRAKQSLG